MKPASTLSSSIALQPPLPISHEAMTHVSKMVADRISISGTVMSSLAVHGPEVAPRLEALLFPDGPPASVTVAGLLRGLHDLLARNREQLGAADLAHAAELADDEAPRAARDGGITALRATLSSLRVTLLNTFGPALLAAYGVPSALPEQPDLLLRTASLIESRLRTRPLTEAPRQLGISIDPVAIADSLKAQIEAITAAVAEVDRERREAQLTLEAKNTSLAAWDAVYPGVADTTTGLYELAGRQDLADVVRPTARRRAGLTEDNDTKAPPPAGAPTEAAPPENTAPQGAPTGG
jgi:hypothetical protein